MTRTIFIFLATFAAGAFAAFATRAALHKQPSAVSEHSAPDHASMVNNALVPASAAPKSGSSHQGHNASPATPAQADLKSVNTVCAICGMKVEPAGPTVEYQGQKIGFACKMCVPKFKADPDKYGPIYLRNEIIKR